jgi:hypothetical protein
MQISSTRHDTCQNISFFIVKKIISLYILNTQPQNPGPATAAKEGVHPADGTGEIYIHSGSIVGTALSPGVS